MTINPVLYGVLTFGMHYFQIRIPIGRAEDQVWQLAGLADGGLSEDGYWLSEALYPMLDKYSVIYFS